jgi:hypothetical protein
LALAWAAVPAIAQTGAPAQAGPPAQGVVVPDGLTVNKLIWSTMAALHHANITGNYSVLRDLGAPSFQSSNSAATLAGVFQALRTQQIDVSNTLLVAPNFDFAPTLIQGGLLRVRGNFPLRPNPIGFDLLFQPFEGQWRLFGLAATPIVPQQPQPAPPRR